MAFSSADTLDTSKPATRYHQVILIRCFKCARTRTDSMRLRVRRSAQNVPGQSGSGAGIELAADAHMPRPSHERLSSSGIMYPVCHKAEACSRCALGEWQCCKSWQLVSCKVCTKQLVDAELWINGVRHAQVHSKPCTVYTTTVACVPASGRVA